MLIRFLLFILFLLVIDFYTFNGIKNLVSTLESNIYKKLIIYTFWGITILFVSYFLIGLSFFDRTSASTTVSIKWLGIILVLFWLPKLVFCIFLLAEDVYRLIYTAFVFTLDKLSFIKVEDGEKFYPERRKFIAQMGLAVAAIPFLSTLYGVTKGKYKYTVKNIILKFKNLPESFEGFTITQISDVHSGSFDDKSEVERGIQMINDLKSDVVLFTGDLVNNIASEFDPWVEVFKKIEAPLGKYSTVGNHDYGDYVPWTSNEEKTKNFENLLAQHGKMGFKLLMNESIEFKRNGELLVLGGVENWGLPPFPQYGDLEKAFEKYDKDVFKILMSHDPSHWDAKVLPFRKDVNLTLSGHTHGMQFGIEIPGIIKWSPVKYKYPRWAGLYEEGKKYLYVNRGFGFIGFSGRVGIWPEITKITLMREG